MKTSKKLASLLLVLVMVMAMATTAMAADTYTITINNANPGHTYEAYQILTGELSEDGKLSSVSWGSGVANAAELEDATVVAAKLDEKYEGENGLNAEDLPAMITLGDPIANSGETCDPYVISGLEAGYYLIKDLDGSLDGTNDSYTEYIFRVSENLTTEPKSDVPSVEKKVQDTNDTTGETSGWQDSADYDLNDAIPYLLKATLAQNVESYDVYKVIFHDSLSAGLTYNNDAVVKLDGVDVTENFTITYEDGKLTVSCNDVKAFGATNGSEITVEYTAILNENAIVGAEGNTNEVYLEYSNNPNWVADKDGDGDVDEDDADTDGDGDVDEDDETEDTGNTPEDKVIVFTYQLSIDKVNAMGEALPGAGFTLSKKNADGSWTAIGEELIGEQMTTFTWTHLDDGDYKLEETTVPTGYNAIDPIEFTITAEHDILSDDPALTALSGDLASGEAEFFTAAVAEGSLSATVVNQAGSVLPSTGGSGTTLFYIVGALTVVGAAVLLISKKRMSAM